MVHACPKKFIKKLKDFQTENVPVCACVVAFRDMFLLCSSDCPGTWYVNKTSFKLVGILVPLSPQVLALQACATAPSLNFSIEIFKNVPGLTIQARLASNSHRFSCLCLPRSVYLCTQLIKSPHPTATFSNL